MKILTEARQVGISSRVISSPPEEMKCYVRATASMPQIVKLVEKRGTVSSSDIKVVLTLLPLGGGVP